MIKRGIQTLAALMMVTASPAYSQVVLSENFSSGTFGIFTPSSSGNVSINTGNGYFPCCERTAVPEQCLTISRRSETITSRAAPYP
jgi:hypothetical protein